MTTTIGMSEKRLMKAADVADCLNCTPASIYLMARERRIPHVRVGAMIRFDRDDINEWIEGRKEPDNDRRL